MPKLQSSSKKSEMMPFLMFVTVTLCWRIATTNGFSTASLFANRRRHSSNSMLDASPTTGISRQEFIATSLVATLLVSPVPSSDAITALPSLTTSAASYSANARNMERMNSGDYSGGSTYNNNPSTPAARKRRALQGCKIPSARQEAASVAGKSKLSESECNQMILEKNADFMLNAMQTLECPTCPYGVNPNRP